MPRFRYQALTADGQSLTGEVESADLAAARQELLLAGLQVQELALAATGAGPFSASDTVTVSQHLAIATQSVLPLIGSLRALSEEVLSLRLRRRLIAMCESLEAGEPLHQVLSRSAPQLPSAVGSILSSGMPPAAMNHLLTRALRAASTTADLRFRTLLVAVYPVVISTSVITLGLYLMIHVTFDFVKIFEDFGTELPGLTVAVISFSRLVRSAVGPYFYGIVPLIVPILIALGLLAVPGLVLIRKLVSPATRRRIWCGIPIIGSMYRLTALSEFARLLALMLESEIPLPQAIVWSAAGVNDADLQACCEDVAARMKWGEDPVTASQSVPGVPSYLEQMLRYAALGPAGSDPLRMMAQLLEARAKSMSTIAMPMLEPLLLTGALIVVSIYVLALFMPLIKLLNDLS